MSNVYIYKNCEITKDKLFKVDEIETYLSTLNKVFIGEFQYIKHNLSLTINISANQTYLDMTEINNFNYLSIQNDNEKIYYYFIINKKWRGESTIQLELSLDTINTFYDQLVFDDKTRVLREHKNRFISTDNPKIYRRNIHLFSEGVNPPLFATDYGYIEQANLENNSFYIVYKNKDVSSSTSITPIKATLYADSPVDFTIRMKYKEFIFKTNDYVDDIYIKQSENPNLVLYVYDILGESIQKTIIASNGDYYRIIPLGDGSATLQYYNSVVKNWIDTELIFGKIRGENLDEGFLNYTEILHYPNDVRDTLRTIPILSSVDRTDSKLVKIIMLPYLPVKVVKEGDKLILNSSDFSPNGGFDLNINKPLIASILDDTQEHNALSNLNCYIPQFGRKEIRNIYYESKLYHSDFFQPKYVYDSFSFTYSLELVNQNATINDLFTFNFVMTSTINSRFLFEFVDYDCNNLITNDYYNILVVQRNNEITLYNSDYLNYIRTGYNYDIKQKNRDNLTSWIGVGLSAVGSVAAFGSSVVSGGFGIAQGVSMGVSTINQITNTIKNSIDRDETIKEKITQAKAQAVSVSGADDVDLMKYYAHNKLKYMEYKCSYVTRGNLFNLFYYCGYTTNEMKIPDTTSRRYFNYLQCEPVFKPSLNISEEILENIKMKLNQGITILHNYEGEYDFKQELENWETDEL